MGDRPRERGGRRRKATAPLFVTLLAVSLAAGPTLPSFGQQDNDGLDLSTTVRLQVRRLQETWIDWTKSYYQDDQEQARSEVVRLLSIAEDLGMQRLPDQAIAAAGFAVRSAVEGKPERARWTVDVARQLDPGRPEVEFASSHVERLAGNYPAAVSAYLLGLAKLRLLPLEGQIWKQNLGVWGIYVLVVSAGLFLLLMMVFRGTALYYDLGRLVSPPLPRVGADVVAALLLLWPLVLPAGVLWLALLWTVLLWGYGTWSQRGVMTVLLVLLGLVPLATAYQQSKVEEALSPTNRLIANLENSSLYGRLFDDFEKLAQAVGDNDVMEEFRADLYMRLGQWEDARMIYDRLIAADGENKTVAPAINNLGLYHHRKGEYGTAVNYFVNATQVDPSLTEAYFNLYQAYNLDFKFTEGHEALAQAKKLEPAKVELWESSAEADAGSGIQVSGAIRRADELRRALAEAGTDDISIPKTGGFQGLLVALGVVAAAAGLHSVRQKKGYPSAKFSGRPTFFHNRWLRALVPGWASTETGSGIGAIFGILLPVALVLVPVARAWGYRPPLGYDVAGDMIVLLCLPTLGMILLVRLWLALRS